MFSLTAAVAELAELAGLVELAASEPEMNT